MKRTLPEVLCISLAIMALVTLFATMQNRDLKMQIADEEKELHRRCLMQQGQALIEMPCTVLNNKYASTF